MGQIGGSSWTLVGGNWLMGINEVLKYKEPQDFFSDDIPVMLNFIILTKTYQIPNCPLY